MAETVVWNKKLLVASLALGLAAAILFYASESIEDARARKNVFRVLAWKANRQAGDEVSDKDLEVVTIPRESYVTGVARDSIDDRSLVVNKRLLRDVQRGNWVRFSDVLRRSAASRTQQPRKGYVGFTLPVDPNQAPRELYRGDKVALIGLVSVGGKPPDSYVLIDNVRVLGPPEDSTMSQTGQRGSGRGLEQPFRVQRSLMLEVDVDTAKDLVKLLVRLYDGKIRVVLRSSDELANPSTDAKIDVRLQKLLKEPLPISTEPMPEPYVRP